MPTASALQLLPHKSYQRAQLLLAAGRRDQGKTWALTHYIEECEPRVLALDWFRDFPGLAMSRTWLDALDDMADGRPCRRRLVPPLRGSRAWSEHFLSHLAYGECEGLCDQHNEPLRNALLVLDEITRVSTAHPSEVLETLVLQGRRLGIRLLIACQRIALVPGVLLSECTDLICFRMSRPRDLDVLEEWTTAAAAETAPNLSVGQCLVFSL